MCAYESSNHSTDTVAVYHGQTEPTILCGYHASWSGILNMLPEEK